MSKNLFFYFFCFNCIFYQIKSSAGDHALQQASEYLLDGLDKSIKPCDNVFGFLCTKFVSSIENSSEYYDYSYLGQQKYILKKFLHRDLFRAIDSIDVQQTDLSKYKLWLKTYYDRCLAMPQISDDEFFEHLYNGLERNLEPPPFLVAQNKSLYDQLMLRNLWYFFGRVQRSAVGGVLFEVNIMNVQQTPTMVLDASINRTPLNESAIKNYLQKFAQKINISSTSTIDQKISKIIDFQKDLVDFIGRTSGDVEDFGEYVYFNNTEQLKAVNLNISWDEYFRGLFSTDDQYERWDKEKMAKFKINKGDMNFFRKLDELIGKHDLETLFNYAFCNSMKRLMEEAVDFKKELIDGDQKIQNETCMKSLTVVYNTALLKIYFDIIGENGKNWQSEVTSIVRNVMHTFESEINKLNLLTAAEKVFVVNGLKSINYLPAIPDWFDSEEEIEKNTIKFDPAKGTFDNFINIKRRMFYLELERYITGSLEQNDRLVFADIGWYASDQLGFLLGSILPPLFHKGYPLAIKYGIFGTRVAQALMGAFDENRYYVTLPNDTWTKFLNFSSSKRQCLEKQVVDTDCPKVPQQCHDIKAWFDQTMISLLSEIDGLRLSYLAYRSALSNATNPANTQSKGLNPDLSGYTDDEIFFMFVGKSLCFSYYFENDLEDGGKTKADGSRLSKVIRNSPEFGKTFKCEKNSSSYLEFTCTLWT